MSPRTDPHQAGSSGRLRACRLLLPVATLLACHTPAVVQSQAEPACPDSAPNQDAMTVCSGEAFRNADRRLAELIAELRNVLPTPRLATLDSAQQGWTRYATAQCRLASGPEQAGGGYAMQVTRCRHGLTERRIAELAPLLCGRDRSTGEPCPAAERYTRPSWDPEPR